MEVIRGKTTSFINRIRLDERLAGADAVHIDIGTGDGRFVRHLATTCPTDFVIGIDANRDNLQDVSRRAPDNTLFVIANALTLPPELHGVASHVTINFPWGSLIEGLLTAESSLLEGLQSIAQPRAALEVRLNAGALAEAGWSLEVGSRRIREVLTDSGFDLGPAIPMTAQDLKAIPTTWAKRLAFGRDPRAVWLRGTAGVWHTASLDPSLALPVNGEGIGLRHN